MKYLILAALLASTVALAKDKSYSQMVLEAQASGSDVSQNGPVSKSSEADTYDARHRPAERPDDQYSKYWVCPKGSHAEMVSWGLLAKLNVYGPNAYEVATLYTSSQGAEYPGVPGGPHGIFVARATKDLNEGTLYRWLCIESEKQISAQMENGFTKTVTKYTESKTLGHTP
jgi:hypothetical protein